MRPKSLLLLVGLLQAATLLQCNPINFANNPATGAAMPSLIAFSPYHSPGSPLLMAGQQQLYADPYASMLTPFLVPASAAYGAPASMSWPPLMSGGGGQTSGDMSTEASSQSRRTAAGGLFGGSGGGAKGERAAFGGGKRGQQEAEPTDEQKALDGLPLSLIEPEPPSSFSERISESFSALGEGVKNHFRSMSENFSDTMDDIRDAWRPSASGSGDGGESRKRRS